ncbi:MAG: alpha-amylase family protein, partial [Planctomycetota bacterium]
MYCGGGLTGACCSATCVARLAAFLKERYLTVEALNRQWEADYRSFDEVLGLGHPQNKDKEAQSAAMRRTGNYSRLIDQWLSNYATFVDAIRFCRENLQRLEPRARLGISTPLWNYYYRGYDWANIMGELAYATPYGPWGDYSSFEAIRSFARPGTILSAHYGSYVEPCLNDEEHFRMAPYAVLLRGCANVFWYTTWSNEGGLSPWLDPYPCLLRSSEEIRKLKQGPGRLLLGARRGNDGIAIHSSQASFLFSFAVSGPAVPWHINSLAGALQELGLQYDLVSTDQILAGALQNYRALLMPASQCIGDAEAAKIREFVEKGGLAVADVRPGIADGHGRIGAQPIQQLFGLKWGAELLDDPEPDAKKKARLRPMREVAARFAGTFAGKAFQGPEIDKIAVDPVLSLDGAEAAVTAGGIPVLTRRVCGKGAAVCLNCDVYPSNPRIAANARNLLFLVLSAQGIEAAAGIEEREEGFSPGAWVPGLEAARFDDGEAKYFGVVRRKLFDAGDAKPGRLRPHFPSAAHVYDMREGRYLGNVDHLDLTVAPSSAKLFALLPYRVEKLTVALDKPAVRAGETVTVSVAVVSDGKPAGRHVIHLEAQRPDGQSAMYLSQCAEAKAGQARLAVPLAINEPAGEWQLRLTDAATKVSESVKIAVTPAR